MRFSAAIAVFSLFAASASASVTPLHRRQFPNCANDCLANPNLGGCKAGDDTCLCNNDVFVSSTFQCIEAACKGQDLATAIEGAAALCAAVHVTLVSAAGAEFSATAVLPSSSAPSAPAGAQTSGTAASDVTSNTDTSSAPAPTTTPNTGSARSSAANTAFVGLAAIGAFALAL
ncbi:hypothetical protein B0H17DRAFT_1193708 [Mycena rosella]|uniref:CFEM domain-containing protein n=1 Tax=Mycena rosella TaxID=1033263 RepID=A0AAD7M7D1_MYCRO|nr:hypothetical protein B0H17DRAFT_1193708 [Mycena rosella]